MGEKQEYAGQQINHKVAPNREAAQLEKLEHDVKKGKHDKAHRYRKQQPQRRAAALLAHRADNAVVDQFAQRECRIQE